jgi:hypothetical protein
MDEKSGKFREVHNTGNSNSKMYAEADLNTLLATPEAS